MATAVQYYVLALFAFAAWAVSLAGIASAQNSCDDLPAIDGAAAGFAGVNGFSATVVNCSKVFRFWWYVVIYEFVILVGLVVSVATKSIRSQSASWLGLLTVATLLYIQAAEGFLTAQDVSKVTGSTVITARTRTMVAGSIMTAVMNCFVVIVLGIQSEEEGEKQPSVKADVI